MLFRFIKKGNLKQNFGLNLQADFHVVVLRGIFVNYSFICGRCCWHLFQR
jgi:hypothetical protein